MCATLMRRPTANEEVSPMLCSISRGHSLCLLGLLFAALANTGCATFNADPLHLLTSKKVEPLDPAKAVIVEMRSENVPREAKPLAYEDGMLVQDALAKS